MATFKYYKGVLQDLGLMPPVRHKTLPEELALERIREMDKLRTWVLPPFPAPSQLSDGPPYLHKEFVAEYRDLEAFLRRSGYDARLRTS